MTPKEVRTYLSPANYKKLSKVLQQLEFTEEEPPNELLLNQLLTSKSYNNLPQGTEGFKDSWELSDTNLNEELTEPRIYFEKDSNLGPTEYGSGMPDLIFNERNLEFIGPREEIFRELKQKQQEEDDNFNRKWKMKPVLYSEGGAEPETLEDFEDQQREIAMRDDLTAWDRYNLGFKRPERLDVKKPGPPFDPAISKPGFWKLFAFNFALSLVF